MISILAAGLLLLATPSIAVSVLIGLEDDFQDGPDPLFPSAPLQASLADFGGCQDLDLVAGEGLGLNNRQVAHTFADLPNGIDQAWLEFKIRAGDDPGVESDGVFLTIVNENTMFYSDAILWSRSFGPVAATPPYYPTADPGLVGSWATGDEATIIVDLSALPQPDGSTVSITHHLTRLGFLDVNISDETGADYFRLTWTIGPTDAPQIGSRIVAAADLRSFPNPCRDTNTLSFSLERAGPVRLSVFDVMGRRVRTFAGDQWAAGTHRLDWKTIDENGRTLPPGAYFVKLDTPGASVSDKITIVR